MREIKFRLRIGNEIIGYERWYKGDGSNAHWEHLKIGETAWKPAFLYATEKDLFTGLPDKNGKEIYEGDIVSWSNESAEEVIFRNGQFTVDIVGEYHKPYWEACEVIGNIYENPELLKGKARSE